MAMLLMFACNTAQDKKDSVEAAEDKNEQKTEQKTDTMATENQMDNDNEFVVKAASGGLMEVELGQMAAKQATNSAVKSFGQMMVTDHTKANAELKALAARKNITIPTTPGEDHMDHINKMRDKKAKDFDKDYMSFMADDHKEDVNDFEKAAKDAKDADIRAFAAKYLPILKQHLEKARSVNDMLK